MANERAVLPRFGSIAKVPALPSQLRGRTLSHVNLGRGLRQQHPIPRLGVAARPRPDRAQRPAADGLAWDRVHSASQIAAKVFVGSSIHLHTDRADPHPKPAMALGVSAYIRTM